MKKELDKARDILYRIDTTKHFREVDDERTRNYEKSRSRNGFDRGRSTGISKTCQADKTRLREVRNACEEVSRRTQRRKILVDREYTGILTRS